MRAHPLRRKCEAARKVLEVEVRHLRHRTLLKPRLRVKYSWDRGLWWCHFTASIHAIATTFSQEVQVVSEFLVSIFWPLALLHVRRRLGLILWRHQPVLCGWQFVASLYLINYNIYDLDEMSKMLFHYGYSSGTLKYIFKKSTAKPRIRKLMY